MAPAPLARVKISRVKISRVKIVSALAMAALIAAPLPAAGAADPLDSAQARAAELRARLDSLQQTSAVAVGEFEAVHSELEQAVGEYLSAESALTDARSRNMNAQDHAGDRVRAIYKSGGRTALYASVLSAGDPQDALSRVANISAIVSVDTASADRATASEAKAVVAAAKFERAIGVRQKLEVEAEKQTLEVDRLMAAQEQLIAGADADVQALVAEQERLEEAARQVAAEAEARRLSTLMQVTSTGDVRLSYSPAGGTYACPAGTGVNFINSWGAPRSGGRSHQGTDVFAPYGSAAYAVTDGVVDRWGNGGLGGITLWIRAANGDRFYYAHNSVNLLPVGTRVRAGDVVALVGKTGNAAGTPAHIHFEAHPGGAGAANPYPFLAAICGQH